VHDATVARSYAAALFELGEKHNVHDELAVGLNTLTSLLDGDPLIRTFVETPKLDAQRKQRALRAALEHRVSPLFMNFLLVVLRKRRQRLLRDMAREYGALLDEKMNRLHAHVTLAHEPDDVTEDRIRRELSRILGKTVVPHIHVNPEILGGIIVRYGDRVVDASLRRRLLALRHRLVDVALPGSDGNRGEAARRSRTQSH
jgi:F-type H+-transporting ATPase subunit delta